MIHKSHRIFEIFKLSEKYGFTVKKMRFVHSFEDSNSHLVMFEFKKGKGHFVKVNNPLIIYEKKGEYSKEILKIYGKD